MKMIIRIIPVLAAVLLIQSSPVIAGSGTMGQDTEQGATNQKDQCLIVAKNCTNDPINVRVERLEREIDNGSAVYSDRELDQLRRELKDASRVQQIFENHFPPVSL